MRVWRECGEDGEAAGSEGKGKRGKQQWLRPQAPEGTATRLPPLRHGEERAARKWVGGVPGRGAPELRLGHRLESSASLDPHPQGTVELLTAFKQ